MPVLDHLLVLNMTHSCFHEDMLHDLPRHRGEVYQSAIPQVFQIVSLKIQSAAGCLSTPVHEDGPCPSLSLPPQLTLMVICCFLPMGVHWVQGLTPSYLTLPSGKTYGLF